MKLHMLLNLMKTFEFSEPKGGKTNNTMHMKNLARRKGEELWDKKSKSKENCAKNRTTEISYKLALICRIEFFPKG